MSNEEPKKKRSVTSFLLIALAVVVVGSLAVVMGICSGVQLTSRAGIGRKALNLAVTTLPLIAPAEARSILSGRSLYLAWGILTATAVAAAAYFIL